MGSNSIHSHVVYHCKSNEGRNQSMMHKMHTLAQKELAHLVTTTKINQNSAVSPLVLEEGE